LGLGGREAEEAHASRAAQPPTAQPARQCLCDCPALTWNRANPEPTPPAQCTASLAGPTTQGLLSASNINVAEESAYVSGAGGAVCMGPAGPARAAAYGLHRTRVSGSDTPLAAPVSHLQPMRPMPAASVPADFLGSIGAHRCCQCCTSPFPRLTPHAPTSSPAPIPAAALR